MILLLLHIGMFSTHHLFVKNLTLDRMPLEGNLDLAERLKLWDARHFCGSGWKWNLEATAKRQTREAGIEQISNWESFDVYFQCLPFLLLLSTERGRLGPVLHFSGFSDLFLATDSQRFSDLKDQVGRVGNFRLQQLESLPAAGCSFNWESANCQSANLLIIGRSKGFWSILESANCCCEMWRTISKWEEGKIKEWEWSKITDLCLR